MSALYCMRDVLTAKKERSKILIVCPNNKKNEWKSDIQRQLGRYAHYVENNDDEKIYNSNLKELFFKSNEPCIFIEGQKENIKWDLVVIDEGHLCFDNYKHLKGEKTILLTATPIVVNSSTIDGGLDISKVRKLQDYVVLLKEITNCKEELQLDNLFVNNNLFTQLFRE